jgi:hypothetical protein
MRRLSLIAAAASLLMVACTPAQVRPDPLPNPATPVVQKPKVDVDAVEDRVILEASKALTLAAITYEGMIYLLNPIVDAGAIKGNTAATVQTANKIILEALERGYKATSAADKARYAATAMRWIDRVKELAGIATPH